MFVGHTAVALAASSRVPRVPLGWWVAAAFGLDLLWPIFLLLGIEKASIAPGATAFNPLVFDHYPWSHSLLMACVWGLCAFGIAHWRGIASGASWLLAAVVVSHWVLDWITHAPDMPLWPGNSPLLGLGLWDSIAGTVIVEGAMFAAGIWLYLRATRAADRVGSVGMWAFLAFSALMWITIPWSPPPPSEQVLAWFALGGYLLVAWAWWADRHRSSRSAASA
jgi:hypothetical protein